MVGIAADAASVTQPELSEIAEPVASGLEVIGAGKTIYETLKNDNATGLKNITVAVIVNLVKEDPIVKVRLGRAVPRLGSIGSAYYLYNNLAPNTTISINP